MTRFLNGPAAGQTLMLCRGPIFLRVTLDDKQQWDALDQPEDSPRPSERVFAYRLEGEPSVCFIRATGGRGGRYVMADYRFIPDRPEEAVMRDNAAWVEWVERTFKETA